MPTAYNGEVGHDDIPLRAGNRASGERTVWLFLSVIGFWGFLIVDLSAFRQRPSVRNSVLVLASLALMLALYTAIARGARVPLAPFYRGLGGFLTAVGALVTLYVVFLEIPMWQRYGSNPHPPLVQEGTYAACRHPGVWGMLMFLVGICLLVPGPSVWQLAVAWGILELVLVTFQDVWLFPRAFPEYPAYRARTPFLFPTKESIRAAWRSYKRLLSSFPRA